MYAVNYAWLFDEWLTAPIVDRQSAISTLEQRLRLYQDLGAPPAGEIPLRRPCGLLTLLPPRMAQSLLDMLHTLP